MTHDRLEGICFDRRVDKASRTTTDIPAAAAESETGGQWLGGVR